MSAAPFDLIAARLDEGTVVLEASAGTGKTYTLTGIVLRLLLENVVERLDQILVVTFTIAATDELKARLRRALRAAVDAFDAPPDRLPDQLPDQPPQDPFLRSLLRHGEAGRQKLRTALDQFDQLGVQTIHGFCKRLLDDAAFESHEPFELDFALDELPLWELAAADALRRVRQFDGPVFGALLHGEKIEPGMLVTQYRTWRRYPDVKLDPAEPEFESRLQALGAAMLAAVALWTPQARDRLLHATWLASVDHWPTDHVSHVLREEARLHEQPLQSLDFLWRCAPSRLAKAAGKASRGSFDLPFFTACEQVLAARDEAVAHLRSHLLRDLHDRLEAHKRSNRVITFQDLLERVHRALHDPTRRQPLLASLRQRYAVGLIDEFQDTDSLQYDIFAAIFANRPLFLIGDPKQSIYGFRGADLRTYTAATTDAVANPTLITNYRSAAMLVAATSRLFGRADAFVLPELRLPQVQPHDGAEKLTLLGDGGAPFRWRSLPPPPWEMGTSPGWPVDAARPVIAADVAAEITRLLHSGLRLGTQPLRPGDIAVLTRLNIEATLLQDVLRRHGIHAVIGKAGDIFATDEMRELDRVLRAVLLPTDLQRARAAMATRLWGLDAATLVLMDADDDTFDRQLVLLERWRQTWARDGFFVMQEQMLADLDTTARLLVQAGGERRLTNLKQLGEMLHQAEHEHRLTPEGLMQWLDHERRQQDEVDYQRRELRLESDADAVQILTMHGSKGLQYEVVFCPFLWDGRQPPKNNVVVADEDGGRHFAAVLAGNQAASAAAARERLAEDVRLAYVAITRARRRCYVHWGPIGSHQSGFHRSALGWLLRPADDDKDWEKTMKGRASLLDGDLRDYVAASGGTMAVDTLDITALLAPPVPPATAPPPTMPSVAPRPLPSRRAFGLHSFTSMVAHREAEAIVRDVRDPSLSAPTPATAGSEIVSSGIFGFARGAEAGVCLHEILEHVSLSQLDDDTATRVRTTLQAHGLLDAAAHPGTVEPERDVMQNLRDLAGALVQPAGPTLADLTRGAHAAEWQFTFPLAATDLRLLAQHFADHGSAIARAYAPRLATLPPRTLHGFVNGFADLIAEHDGRYWVLDWKSNHLGNQLDDYGEDALQRSMFEHDYVLQYHVYALALHLHLRSRLPGYDFERHFGGAVYVYLRGAKAGTTSGMFCDRPPAALLDAMQRWALGSRGRA